MAALQTREGLASGSLARLLRSRSGHAALVTCGKQFVIVNHES